MKIGTSTLLLSIVVLTTSCTTKPVQPQFETLAIDTLIGTPGTGRCNIQYRFATIANAQKSGALEAIEQSNINYFFELEEFAGPAKDAITEAIRQTAAETLPAPSHSATQTYDISVESEGAVVDSLVSYVITRSSYTGGAHGMYSTECHTYSLTGGYEFTTADLFDEAQLQKLNEQIHAKLCKEYGAATDSDLSALGFFPEYIAVTENFCVTPEGITFLYNPYDIGCYALGAVEVSFSREELQAL